LISNPNEGHILPNQTTGLETFLVIENGTPEHNVEQFNCAEILCGRSKTNERGEELIRSSN
jgi:hypothetical protein